jgi:hypothetical protein
LIEGLCRSWTNTPAGTRAGLGEYVSGYVVVPWDVLELDPLEVAFEFMNLSTVSIHRVLDAVPLLVDLLDDDLGIAKSQ